MNCVFFVSAALLSLHTAVGATEYIIPEAVSLPQWFSLDGSTMGASVFNYTNSQNCSIYFDFQFKTKLSPQASVTFASGNGEYQVFNESIVQILNASSAQFTLAGDWTEADKGTVEYRANCGRIRVTNDRNATNLYVWGDYAIADTVNTTQRIWARDNCRVAVKSGGTTLMPGEQCTTELSFVSPVAGDPTMSADQSGTQVVSVGNHADFNLKSNCSFGLMRLYYQEDCAKTQTPTPNGPTTSSTTSLAMFPTPMGLLIMCTVLILTI